ncbi:hypothetical protein FBUS_03959 [Fasciolopsis buskii]|uniref:Uncharacterized protein n=1 Tax=Fasciolopsis buskii TaxID=27845 RepID=A0A8E0S4X1_9TREM|nr:hypothetical protein FBUS_03959 [Fasciolopsis buski]
MPCTVTEECPVGTVVCNLKSVWDKYGMPGSFSSGLADTSAESVSTRPQPQITVINEAKAFVILGNQIVTRDRIDREHYVLTKQCRDSMRSNENEVNPDRNDLGKPVYLFFSCVCVCVCMLACGACGRRTAPSAGVFIGNRYFFSAPSTVGKST